MRTLFTLTYFLMALSMQSFAQENNIPYKKRILDSPEIEILMGYYQQEGNHAAVSGGIGNEDLTDIVPTVVISVPLNEDDVLKIDASVSAYTSASSSNINPFDSELAADPYIATSGASESDIWFNTTITYSHASDDRNSIWSGKVSTSNEFDYVSFGVGGSYTKLFNQKNTEISFHASVYLDTWNPIYPYELRQFDGGSPTIYAYNTEGEVYERAFKGFSNDKRNSYSVGINFAQILSKRAQLALMGDITLQDGLLSTPFQRVYFQDSPDFFIGNFQLADDIERLPNQRIKSALGGRLNYYLNEHLVVRSYYRFYSDDWGVTSQTFQLELPIKIGLNFTLYPSYRYYLQTASDYFAPYEKHLSTESYYTSDYDLSSYNAHQLGFGLKYSSLHLKKKVSLFYFKSISIQAYRYQRVNGLKAMLFSGGAKLILDP